MLRNSQLAHAAEALEKQRAMQILQVLELRVFVCVGFFARCGFGGSFVYAAAGALQ